MQEAHYQTAPQKILDVFKIEAKPFGELPPGTIIDKKFFGPVRRDIVSFLSALGIEGIDEDLDNVNLLMTEATISSPQQPAWTQPQVPSKEICVIRSGSDKVTSFTVPLGLLQQQNAYCPPWMGPNPQYGYGAPGGEHHVPGYDGYMKAREFAEMVRQGLAFITTNGEGSAHPLI